MGSRFTVKGLGLRVQGTGSVLRGLFKSQPGQLKARLRVPLRVLLKGIYGVGSRIGSPLKVYYRGLE